VLSFNILGALEVVGNDCQDIRAAPKVRNVLALLLVRAGRVVDVDSFIQELWGDDPPRSAVTTVQTYICHIRKKLERDTGPNPAALVTMSPGYALKLGDAVLDARRFQDLTNQGQRLLENGQAAEAAIALREALALWRGRALANVSAGPLLAGYVAHLEDTRIRALELRIHADIELGRSRELIPELRSLVAAYPLNEWMHGRLIDALHRAGRRGEALAAYQSVRVLLRNELGLEPSPELQRLQRAVLDGHEPARRPVAGPEQLRWAV
jgi:SARP family transcriptional regulator, regulator of embCAB operon